MRSGPLLNLSLAITVAGFLTYFQSTEHCGVSATEVFPEHTIDKSVPCSETSCTARGNRVLLLSSSSLLLFAVVVATVVVVTVSDIGDVWFSAVDS